MDLRAGIRKRKTTKVISDDLSELYPHDIQLYNVPPGNEITLSEFEDLAIERLELLRLLEQAANKGEKVYSQEWRDMIVLDVRKKKLTNYINLLDPKGGPAKLLARRADHISHFILRLAYCRSEDLRRWFLTREQEWFKLRFMMLNADGIKSFLHLNRLTYTTISSEEKDSILSELFNSTAGVNSVDIVDFYKVPFTEVFTLVRNKRIYLHNGFAYVPSFELVTSILSNFRSSLSEALASASRIVPTLDDDRLNGLLMNLHTSYTGRDYGISENKEIIDIEYLDRYSRDHFPLCMRYMHETFRTNHHMKHGVRLQYGLFLKGIGVSYEDCMKLWRDEFTKLIDDNQFEKQYSYIVKHHYGKVGSLVSYSSYSCMKIITGNVGSGEYHGCPFRHFDTTNLKQKMISYGISNKGIEEILELVKNTHYQIACTKYFEYTHGQPSKETINHPNQFFEESRTLASNKNVAVSTPSSKKPKPSVNTPKLDDTWSEEMEF